MAKLGCKCGTAISDHSAGLPNKASFLKDSLAQSFWDMLAEDLQDYVSAAERGETREWMLNRGYGRDYAGLGLSHGDMLHDHIHSLYLRFKRDMFEYATCGRVLIEENTENQFLSYAPDLQQYNSVLGPGEDGI